MSTTHRPAPGAAFRSIDGNGETMYEELTAERPRRIDSIDNNVFRPGRLFEGESDPPGV